LGTDWDSFVGELLKAIRIVRIKPRPARAVAKIINDAGSGTAETVNTKLPPPTSEALQLAEVLVRKSMRRMLDEEAGLADSRVSG